MSRITDIPASTWNRIRLGALAVAVANIGLEHVFRLGVLDPPVMFGAPLVGIGAGLMSVERRKRDHAELRAKDEKAAADTRWRAEVYRLTAPDPRPGQCPVCGMEDLFELTQRDAFLHLTGTPGARVTAYGPVSAHQECAEIAPYEKYYMGTAEGRHHRGLHHAERISNCAACKREKDTGTPDPYPPPDGCTCSACRPPDVDARLVNDVTTNTGQPGAITAIFSMSGGAIMYEWHCTYGDGAGCMGTHAEAKQALRDHAAFVCKERRTPEQRFTDAMMAIANSGVSITHLIDDSDARRLASIKDATAPRQDAMEWLMRAVKSADPGLREPAWRLINKMMGIEP